MDRRGFLRTAVAVAVAAALPQLSNKRELAAGDYAEFLSDCLQGIRRQYSLSQWAETFREAAPHHRQVLEASGNCFVSVVTQARRARVGWINPSRVDFDTTVGGWPLLILDDQVDASRIDFGKRS
jgi:hypothetical protein